MDEEKHILGGKPCPPYDTAGKVRLGFVILAIVSCLLIIYLVVSTYGQPGRLIELTTP